MSWDEAFADRHEEWVSHEHVFVARRPEGSAS
jgi:hypothetical protein